MWEDLKLQFLKGNMVIKLIFVNVIIFFLIELAYIPFWLMYGQNGFSLASEYYGFFSEWFYLPSDLSKLVYRPWTIITYMFLHSGLLHLFFNMLMLYWFGRIVGDLINNNRVLPLYLLGGLAGGFLFVLCYNLFPVFSGHKPPILGASASVMAIVIGAATINPKGLFYVFLIGEVQLRYIALVLFLLDVIAIPDGNAGGRFAHIGGAIMGWVFVTALRSGRDWSKPINKIIKFISRPFSRNTPLQTPFRREPQPVYKTQNQQNQPSATFQATNNVQAPEDINPIYRGYSRDFLRNYRHLSRQGCIDAILDKIRKTGVSSLSEEEKTFLNKMSQE